MLFTNLFRSSGESNYKLPFVRSTKNLKIIHLHVVGGLLQVVVVVAGHLTRGQQSSALPIQNRGI
jgi:hypothetical protein